MSFNLVDLVKSQLPTNAGGALGDLFGEDHEKTGSAISAAVPGLLNGFASAAERDGGASLFDAVSNFDDGVVDNVSDLFSNNTQATVDRSSGLLGSLLGSGALGSLASAVSGFSGIGSRSSSGILGLVAPIVIGIIKRKLFGGGGIAANAGGLLNMLKGQTDNIGSAMPIGFSNQLRSSGFTNQIGGAVSDAADSVARTGSAAVDRTADAARDTARSGGGLLRSLLPLAALVLLGLLAWRFFAGGSGTEVADTVSDAASNATQGVTVPSVMVGDTDFGKSLGGVFTRTTEAVSGITDVDSAKAAVPVFGEITGEVDNLSGLWDKVPGDARGAIGKMTNEGLGSLTPMIDKVQELPGVGDVISPAIGPLLEKLKAFGG